MSYNIQMCCKCNDAFIKGNLVVSLNCQLFVEVRLAETVRPFKAIFKDKNPLLG